MLNREGILPISIMKDWSAPKLKDLYNYNSTDLDNLIIQFIHGVYQKYTVPMDTIVDAFIKIHEHNEQTNIHMLELVLLVQDFWFKLACSLKGTGFLERHQVKMSRFYKFHNKISHKSVFLLVEYYKHHKSILKNCFYLLNNIPYECENSHFQYFLRYLFLKDGFKEWIVAIYEKKLKIDSKAKMDLSPIFLPSIEIYDFFIEALKYSRDVEQYLIYLKSHKITAHLLHRFIDKSVIFQTFDESKKYETIFLFEKIRDQELLKEFIIKTKSVFLYKMLFEFCTYFDIKYFEALMICKNYIHKISGEKLTGILQSRFLNAFIETPKMFKLFCLALEDKYTNHKGKLLLGKIEHDEDFIKKIRIFLKIFPSEWVVVNAVLKFWKYLFDVKGDLKVEYWDILGLKEQRITFSCVKKVENATNSSNKQSSDTQKLTDTNSKFDKKVENSKDLTDKQSSDTQKPTDTASKCDKNVDNSKDLTDKQSSDTQKPTDTNSKCDKNVENSKDLTDKQNSDTQKPTDTNSKCDRNVENSKDLTDKQSSDTQKPTDILNIQEENSSKSKNVNLDFTLNENKQILNFDDDLKILKSETQSSETNTFKLNESIDSKIKENIITDKPKIIVNENLNKTPLKVEPITKSQLKKKVYNSKLSFSKEDILEFFKILFKYRNLHYFKQFYESIILLNPNLFKEILIENLHLDEFFILTFNILSHLQGTSLKNEFDKIEFKPNYWYSTVYKYFDKKYFKQVYLKEIEHPFVNLEEKLPCMLINKQQKRDFLEGLVFNNSVIILQGFKLFSLYLYFRVYSTEPQSFISFHTKSKTITFQLRNSKLYYTSGTTLKIVAEVFVTDKIISFIKTSNYLYVFVNNNRYKYLCYDIENIFIGKSFSGIINKILYLENGKYEKYIIEKIVLDKVQFYCEVLKNVERQLSYYNYKGVYIDSLQKYDIINVKVNVRFINVLVNLNWKKEYLEDSEKG